MWKEFNPNLKVVYFIDMWFKNNRRNGFFEFLNSFMVRFWHYTHGESPNVILIMNGLRVYGSLKR